MKLYTNETISVTTIICVLLIIVGVVGNMLIIWTFHKSKHLRVRVNVFVVSLAVVDLLIVSYLLPFNIVILQTNWKLKPAILCTINGIIAPVLFMSSIQYIMLISLSRYVKIRHPQIFDTLFSPTKITLFIICCLLLTISLQIPLLSHDVDHHFIFDESLHMCIFNRHGDRMYSAVCIILGLFLPILTTSLCYVKLYYFIIESRRNCFKCSNIRLARRKLKEQQTSTRTQFSVFIACLVLYFPFGLTCLFQHNKFPDYFHSVSIYFAFANSCINSVLYGVMNSNIRKEYMRVFRCIPKQRRKSFTVHAKLKYRINEYSQQQMCEFDNEICIAGRT
jgi:hypothetical protein